MLAICGGTPVNTKQFEWRSSIDEKDIAAVVEVMKSKNLSGFYGSPGPRFLGGPRVIELDTLWAEHFSVKHAVSMNSATSALYAAVAALGIEPGDEVIVSPLSMAISAVCVLPYGAIPIFADIEPNLYCLDPRSIAERITPRTKAIITVNLFGQPSALDEIMELARRNNLLVIEDSSQAPGAHYKGRLAGTVADIGVYSLNCHKAIQTGEGGIAVTNNEQLARKMQLVRNHAESVISEADCPVNMVGWNYRMTEMQAAMAITQLRKLDSIIGVKQELAAHFDQSLKGFDFIRVPEVRPNCTHVYYLYYLQYLPEKLGVPRNLFIKALNSEGFQAVSGYVRPIYLLPMFQKKIAIGSKGWPFTLYQGEGPVRYDPGLCPVAERLHHTIGWYPNMIRYDINHDDITRFAEAIDKVASNIAHLKAAFPEECNMEMPRA